jgi:(S)-ureidoglycine aminohydrolase
VHDLGSTRSSLKPDHLLQTPDTFVRTPMPGASGVECVVHAGPRLGAAFAQFTAEFAPNGALGPTPAQRFLYVLEGELLVECGAKTHRIAKGSFAYLPQGTPHNVRSEREARAAVIEKPYSPSPEGEQPEVIIGSELDKADVPLMGDAALRVRALMPDGPAYDFAINTMTYDPGAALSMVEIHVMEHGLLMLEGGGIYRLSDFWYPVSAGDFIWMAPYCPQWFGALGKVPTRYLIYKDWNR